MNVACHKIKTIVKVILKVKNNVACYKMKENLEEVLHATKYFLLVNL